jgi:hypothetical protein
MIGAMVMNNAPNTSSYLSEEVSMKDRSDE